jgi:hypothetical protein
MIATLITLCWPAYPKTGLLLNGNNAKRFLIWTPMIPLTLSLLQLFLLLFVYRFDTPKDMKERGEFIKLK